MLEEAFTFGQELHPARRAGEERRAELVLEALDLSRQRRLRDAQAIGGAGHVSGLDDGHGDTSATFTVGTPSIEARHVVDVARRCRDAGIAVVREGARLGDVGAAIADLARREGCSVVSEFGGHGIGRRMHEDPHVPHTGERGTGIRLRAGMVFTIEPMINLGGAAVRVLADGWTVVTKDGCEVLTLCAPNTD